MADVNFDAKTNWKQDETVYPADANRWEEGIKDCADAINENNTEIPKKVNKAGDTMTGDLKILGTKAIRFGTDDDFYNIKKEEGTNNLLLFGKNNTGVFLDSLQNFAPSYWNGTSILRLLTTADLSQQVNPIRLNYSAQVAGTTVVAPSNGFIFAKGSYNDQDYWLKIEDPAGTVVLNLKIGYNNDGPACISVPVTTGQKAYITPGSSVIFVPYY